MVATGTSVFGVLFAFSYWMYQLYDYNDPEGRAKSTEVS